MLPAMMENNVVLPAPFAPMSSQDFSDLHVEGNIVQGPDASEATRHAFDSQ